MPLTREAGYVPVIGPRLRPVLFGVLALFALLVLNSVYLSAVTLAEWQSGETLQDYFYQLMFLAHLLLGVLLTPLAVLFVWFHLRRSWGRPNRRAVQAGLALMVAVAVLLVSGFALMRLGSFALRDPTLRSTAYWLHVASPLAVCWLFVLHRLAGPRIRWRIGLGWLGFAAATALAMVWLHAQDPRRLDVAGPVEGERYFSPALSRTATGEFIPARVLMMDAYCQECHPDVHERWEYSAHRQSSFSNPAYRFSVENTRSMLLARDGDVKASRFCAGCHDPVPFFSGAFDDPAFDMDEHPTAHVGITCTSCHAITHINSPRGNGDYTIEEPLHYPFAFSEDPLLAWTNRQLVLAKPDFHKQTFLKPLHRDPLFCGSCHKVHIPEELNHYKWLRGQNHYDSHLLSGVSGHGAASFYYPARAETSCNDCHMPLQDSDDFAARPRDGGDVNQVHDHLFPAANTALPVLLDMPEEVVAVHQAFLEDTLRVDLFALREGGEIDGTLHGPLRPELPALRPGQTVLLEVVIRTLGLGHHFTQGTADSNQIWLDLRVFNEGRSVGSSGGVDFFTGEVDPWAHFVNAYVLDREGNRIDRRNPEDIFVPLYDHQIPPGAADVVHYRLRVPDDARGSVRVEARLHYRKFDTVYLRLLLGQPEALNTLPITTIATDTLELPLGGAAVDVISGGEVVPPCFLGGVCVGGEAAERGPVSTWERWNDYGIGLLRKPRRRQLRQAEEAFARVEALGRSAGAVNLARVYLEEGRLDEAAAALRRASEHAEPEYPWSIAWLTGLVAFQLGQFDTAIDNFESLVETRFAEARRRGFDFSRDYRVLNRLGESYFESAKRLRAPARQQEREALLRSAEDWFGRVLALDPENLTAHYNLWLLYRELGEEERAAEHQRLHAIYKPDDDARGRAIGIARRRDAAADHAADPVVIYDLQRDDAGDLASQ